MTRVPAGVTNRKRESTVCESISEEHTIQLHPPSGPVRWQLKTNTKELQDPEDHGLHGGCKRRVMLLSHRSVRSHPERHPPPHCTLFQTQFTTQPTARGVWGGNPQIAHCTPVSFIKLNPTQQSVHYLAVMNPWRRQAFAYLAGLAYTLFLNQALSSWGQQAHITHHRRLFTSL